MMCLFWISLILGIIGLILWAIFSSKFQISEPAKKFQRELGIIPAPTVPKPVRVEKVKATLKPSRYLPITKGYIIKKCGLNNADFQKVFVNSTDTADPDTEEVIEEITECIKEQLGNIMLEYKVINVTPIYLMCTKKDLAAYLNITTNKLNKYFQGEIPTLSRQIEKLLTYDDKWAISRLILPS